MASNSTILDSRWFSNSRGLIGIVKTKNTVGEIKYYISLVDGNDETVDARYVADYGSRVGSEIYSFLKDLGVKRDG